MDFLLGQVDGTIHFTPNITLTLICQAADAKPKANITWYKKANNQHGFVPMLPSKYPIEWNDK